MTQSSKPNRILTALAHDLPFALPHPFQAKLSFVPRSATRMTVGRRLVGGKAGNPKQIN
jgi:hypothetical protein